MIRNLPRLADTVFDLLVVGGGIHGLAAAYDASERGLAVALVERGDFGGGLSFNHQRTVHGGLRSLQSFDVGRARESIHERRALARIAPHLLRPMPFLMGTYRSLTRGRVALRAGFRLDAYLGRRRNRDIVPELHLPAARLVSRAACTRLFPGIRTENLTGGAMWYDYQTVEPHRLTLAFALAADAHGAALANHVEAREALRNGGRVAGMRVRDLLTGDDFDVRARVTLNAAGSSAGRVMTLFGVTRPFPLVKTMNLVTTRPVSELALAAAGADGRTLTLVPWHGRALVGTSQGPETTEAPEVTITAGEIDAFLADVNHAFPALRIGRDDVTLVHRGLVPAARGRDGRPTLRAHSAVVDHTADGAPGAITVVGVKYTTGRGVAARALDAVEKRLGRRPTRCRTETQALPGAGIADVEALAIENIRRGQLHLDEDVLRAITRVFGTRCPGVLALAVEQPVLAGRLAPGCPVIKAEVVHAVREEMAVSLADVVLRRTSLAHTEAPAREAVGAAAALMAAELGWDHARVEAERAALEAALTIP